METTPIALIFPVILALPLLLSYASGCLCKYIVMGNFNHKPNPPLFISVKSNFYDLVEVLTEGIHPLDSNLVLKTIIYSGDADDYLY